MHAARTAVGFVRTSALGVTATRHPDGAARVNRQIATDLQTEPLRLVSHGGSRGDLVRMSQHAIRADGHIAFDDQNLIRDVAIG